MSGSVKTYIQRPADLVRDKVSMVVPSYQRPYVWPDDDVVKLLVDINTARELNEPRYYIGTVLSSSYVDGNGKNSADLELIDGQQRITTLVLVALAFRSLGVNSVMGSFAVLNDAPRLHFAIRDQVQELLGAWAGLDGYNLPDYDDIDKDPYLNRLHGALRVLKQRIGAICGEDKLKLKRLAQYIFNNVVWVNNVVPDGVDLNRLFATMNTSGIQLEQSDILKSMLMRKIKNNRDRYDAIWKVCEQMDNYFERNVRKVFAASDWKRMKPADLSTFSSDRFILQSEVVGAAGSPMTIAKLASKAEDSRWDDTGTVLEGQSDIKLGDEDDAVYCRSIIGFPLLLMHAYRVFLEGDSDIHVRLHSDLLIDSFSDLINSKGSRIRRFFECLWEVRYQFDLWVVKWVRAGDSSEEVLGLTDVRRSRSGNNWYLQRDYRDITPLVQLQAVRNFTGERSAQYWLTPFLGWLRYEAYEKEKGVLELLEVIDNQLSLAIGTQKEASYELLQDDLAEIEAFDTVETYLLESHGTHFEHYWFQKLEYLLWKEMVKDSSAEKLRKYRIVSRNSVEHVHPQNEEFRDAMENSLLHCFGNLALLNPGQNSSYSNQKASKKKIDFESKSTYDSLKLKRIFELMGKGDWTETKVRKHRAEMLDIMREHYEV